MRKRPLRKTTPRPESRPLRPTSLMTVPNRVDELFSCERLGEESVHSFRPGGGGQAFSVGVIRARHQDNTRVSASPCANSSREGDPIHPRHVQVGKYYLGGC